MMRNLNRTTSSDKLHCQILDHDLCSFEAHGRFTAPDLQLAANLAHDLAAQGDSTNLYFLFDLTGFQGLSPDGRRFLHRLAKHSSVPEPKAAALVGCTTLFKAFCKTIMAAGKAMGRSQQPVGFFDDSEEAITWLRDQKQQHPSSTEATAVLSQAA